MATINLGAIKFNWKGAYNNGTAYVADDVVSSGGNSYVCILASTGNAVTNGTYWELMAQKGTDTTVATTQGDVLYHNGSSLARLGYGTNGQVLTTGGSGANPSWTTVSSDMVRLGFASCSNAADLHVDLFTTDYDVYKVFITGWYGDSAGQGTRMRFNTSANTVQSGSNYRSILDGYYWNSSGSNGDQRTGAWGESYFPISNLSASASNVGDHEMTFFRPMNASKVTTCIVTGGGHENNHIYSRHGHGYYSNTEQHTGFTLYSSSGNITVDHIEVYGIK